MVRNGSHPPRQLVTGVGKVPVRQPRVDDRREGESFTSSILPRYARRAPSIDALLPVLYLKGLSTSSFPEALKAILGDNVSGLSSANIVRLKQVWEKEYASWRQRDLSDKRYAYVWVDGIYFNVRLQPDRPCVLVVVGASVVWTGLLLLVTASLGAAILPLLGRARWPLAIAAVVLFALLQRDQTVHDDDVWLEIRYDFEEGI